MLKRSLYINLLVIVVMGACKQASKNSFEVNLSFTNADKFVPGDGSGKAHTINKVYLEEIVFGKEQPPVILDSQKLGGSSGTLTLNGKTKAEGLYELMFDNGLVGIPLINDAAEMKMTVDLSKKNDFYSVTGSPATQQLQDLIVTVGKMNGELEKSFSTLDSLKRVNAPDSVLIPATESKNKTIISFNNYLKQIIGTTSNATLGTLALSWSIRSLSQTEFDSAISGLQRRFPASVMLQDLKKGYDAQQTANDQNQSNSWVGKSAPDLTMPDVNGKDISISSFRGKYVLVDFWASWCGPCRMENPNVLMAYNKYKDKNFTILGVSLDKEKDAWTEAIAHDHLSWTQMSDLKYWNSKAVEVFGFQGIPFNVLIDPSGKIVAQELRGSDLEDKLKQVLQ